MPPALDEPASSFTLKDQHGNEHHLSDYRGKWVLLYFYPKDDTPGCTTEACGLRDTIKKYEDRNCIVLGVSADTIESHKLFSEKHSLPFALLADTNKEVINAYSVWGEKESEGKKKMGIVRTSFLIDPEGSIAKFYSNVTPKGHAEEVLKDLKALQAS